MEPLAQSVMVGVTGRGENTDALRFAVSEARTLGASIALVHAIHPLLAPPLPPGVVLDEDDRSFDVGRSILEQVREELQALAGTSLTTTTTARHGEPGPVLAELSKKASRVILQHRDLSRLHRVVTGSTVAATATHASCPVVSVPHAVGDRPRHGLVTVGIRGDGEPRQVLAAAFAEASAHRCSLRVVHADRLAPGYDDLLTLGDDWAAQAEEAVQNATAELREEHPGVAVDIAVRHDWPADALVAAATDSDLLVVGRHAGQLRLPARLGSLARAVIREAGCPVMVVPM
jgi:nucleotide-binding universal stress UspA family protein